MKIRDVTYEIKSLRGLQVEHELELARLYIGRSPGFHLRVPASSWPEACEPASRPLQLVMFSAFHHELSSSVSSENGV